MEKRGVELSLNLIILLVLGLIVLGIVIYIVVDNMNKGNDDISACEAKGGQCKSQCDAGETGSAFFTGGCHEGEICCRKGIWGSSE